MEIHGDSFFGWRVNRGETAAMLRQAVAGAGCTDATVPMMLATSASASAGTKNIPMLNMASRVAKQSKMAQIQRRTSSIGR